MNAAAPQEKGVPQIHRYGANAVLIEVAAQTSHAHAHALRAAFGNRLVDVVPTSEHLLVSFAGPPPLESLIELLRSGPPSQPPAPAGAEFVVPVHYHGADLADVAEAAGCTVAEVIAKHSQARYVVDFFGFAPGFAYLSGLPTELHLPRRSSPRVRVPAGAVAIAAHYCAIYPRPSPGGWHLLGHSDIPLFDVDADPPSPLLPGTRVRFEPMTGPPSHNPPPPDRVAR